MRVGFLQTAPIFGDVNRNLDKVIKRLEGVEADLIVLPELFATGYQFVSKREVAELSEEIPSGQTTRRLAALARDKKIWLVAGLPERSGEKFYNSAVLIGPGGHIGTYRKVHLFYEEKRWFKPGRQAMRSYNIGKARIGMMICFDWYFPESARALAVAGAEIICHPANLVLPHCPDAMVTRCLENRVFAITSNRFGSEKRGGRKRLTYIGKSQIVDPEGKIRFRAARDQEVLRILEIDPKKARRKWLNRYNHILRDRGMTFDSPCDPSCDPS